MWNRIVFTMEVHRKPYLFYAELMGSCKFELIECSGAQGLPLLSRNDFFDYRKMFL